MDKRVGVTTTVPAEVIFAAGKIPVDLNNLLISERDPGGYVLRSERNGFPRNACAWTKGIFEVAKARGIGCIVGVVEGDCSNSRAIIERWRLEGMRVILFAFPHDRSRERMEMEIEHLAKELGATKGDIKACGEMLERIRRKVHLVDELTWREGVVRGEENHLWQVSCSDFRGNPRLFEKELDRFIRNARRRKPARGGVRVGYVGVPPIAPGFYAELERMGFHVVFNELQRQFTLPSGKADIVERYLAYTYPYGLEARLEDIAIEVKKRSIRALVHYVQSFCHRGIEDYMIRREAGVPVLTIECDRPVPLDERNRIRLEAFHEMLSQPKAVAYKP